MHVDDCLLMFETPERTEVEIERINAKHPLSRTPLTTSGSETVEFDLLGADVRFSDSRRTCSLAMPKYVDKLPHKFDCASAKELPVPSFPEENLYVDSKPSTFDLRAFVGGL